MAGLLQVKEGMSCLRGTAPKKSTLRHIAFVSKSLSNADTQYSSIEKEVLGILHGLQKFHHHHFMREV